MLNWLSDSFLFTGQIITFHSKVAISKNIFIYDKVIDSFNHDFCFIISKQFQITSSLLSQFETFHEKEKMKPDFDKMMQKLSENTDLMMMEYAAFFQKEVQANYVTRLWTQ